MIRILIVDDSLTARTLMRALFYSAEDLTVVGEAADGAEAIRLARTLRPDVITMDVQMPSIDGLQATKEIMVSSPTPIVIVSDLAKGTGAAATAMRAIEMGAVAVLSKPPGPVDPRFADEAEKLVATVRAMASVKVVRHWRPALENGSQDQAESSAFPKGGVSTRSFAAQSPIRCVAIATSTGGPAALQQIFSALPETLSAPILVVQHIAHGFTPSLVDWLRGTSSLPITIATAGHLPQPGTIYVAPDDAHLTVRSNGHLDLLTTKPMRGFRPSATPLFESVAQAFGPSALAVILTGMGDDGLDGLQLVKRAGGKVLAQDESSSVVYGMPKAAVEAGLADWVVPLGDIAQSIRDVVAKSKKY